MKNLLTPAEWLVMGALWDNNNLTLSEVIGVMEGKTNWSYRTYASYLNKLVQKGFVNFKQRGRDRFYYASVEKSDCISEESKSIFNKMDDKATKDLLVCMIREKGLTKGEIIELKELLDELSK